MSQPVELPPETSICLKAVDDAESRWKKELAHATTSVSHLLEQLELTHYIDKVDVAPDFKCLVTASYIRKIHKGKFNDPLLQQVLPSSKENDSVLQQTGKSDPVGDINAMASPGLLHKYFGRALLISTGACAVHCRYCFRRHYPYQQSACTGNVFSEALAYLQQHPEVDEIILSGGDPLVLDNARLEKLITQLEAIEHLKTLRLHTRLPVVLPSRVNKGLLRLLNNCRFEVVMVIHTNHANELQQEEFTKLHLLHEAGITLLNQSVLLRGINDDADTLVNLSKRLFQCKTLPYYLHFLDPVAGAMHFDIDKKRALQLKTQMEQQLPGYLVPKLVQEIAGKQAKTAIFRF